MKKEKLISAAVLFVLGLIGIFSLLTADIPIPEEVSNLLSKKFSAQQIKFLTLINPTIMLVLALVLGLSFHKKVKLEFPLITAIINRKRLDNLKSILKFGIFGGIIAGIIISLTGLIFSPILPAEFIELGEKIKPSLAARFLYGGFTEEIITRFGLMTFFAWLFSKIFKNNDSLIYWLALLIAAILFALMHFPVAYQAVESPSFALLAYILLGNISGGIIFGWLYWKKGLESAFIAHMFAHVILVVAEPLLNLS